MSRIAVKSSSKTTVKRGIAEKVTSAQKKALVARLKSALIPASQFLAEHDVPKSDERYSPEWGLAFAPSAYQGQNAFQRLKEVTAVLCGSAIAENKAWKAGAFEGFTTSFCDLLVEATDSRDEYLLADIAELLAAAVSALNCRPKKKLLQLAKIHADPWPLALSAHPNWLKEWAKEKDALKTAYKKRSGTGASIQPSNLPPSNAAMAELVSAEMAALERKVEATGFLPSFSLSSLQAWQKEVTKRIASHPEFPEGNYFMRVDRHAEANTKGKRADELRKAIREVFRTIKRNLEGEQALNG